MIVGSIEDCAKHHACFAGAILKKGRGLYQVPTARARFTASADASLSQACSHNDGALPLDSQRVTASVADPATPSHSEAYWRR